MVIMADDTSADTAGPTSEALTLPAVPSDNPLDSDNSVPAIKLQKKCSSQWTCIQGTAAKQRRGRVKLKLRPALANVVPIKDGDASRRIATDLPRFNWLELKYSQQQQQQFPGTAAPAPSDSFSQFRSAAAASGSLNRKSNPVPQVEMDRSESTTVEDIFYESHLPLKKRADLSSPPVQSRHLSVTSSPDSLSPTPVTVPSMWPLKKRLIRPESSSPVRSSEEIPLFPPERGPVIIKNLILPPTPPSSSAPTETSSEGCTESSDEVQEEPLDLSKVVPVPSGAQVISVGVSNPTPADVQIIGTHKRKYPLSEPIITITKESPRRPESIPARTMSIQVSVPHEHQIPVLSRIHPPAIFSPSGDGAFKAVKKTFNPPRPLGQGSAIVKTSHLHTAVADRERPIAANEAAHSSMQIRPGPSFIQPPSFPAVPWNLHHYRSMPHQLNRPFNDPYRPLARPMVVPIQSRATARFPTLDRLADGWNRSEHYQSASRNLIHGGSSRPEVELLKATQAASQICQSKDVPIASRRIGSQPSTSTIMAAVPRSLTYHLNDQFHHQRSPSTWTSWCNVCSARAGFRCAGCHLNAYCSADCQIKDWPQHSRLCQMNR